MSEQQPFELVYKGFEIRADEQERLCLTDMWKSVGSPPNKRPIDWLQADSTAELLAEYLFQLNSGMIPQLKFQRPGSSRQDRRALERWMQKVRDAAKEAGLYVTVGGRNGGTYATPELAIAPNPVYARRFLLLANTAPNPSVVRTPQIRSTKSSVKKKELTIATQRITQRAQPSLESLDIPVNDRVNILITSRLIC